MNTIDERDVNPTDEIARIAYNILNLAQWGFKESYRSIAPGKLIFDSEWCRINFIWDGWDYLGGNTISIRYGRLHASNEKSTMIWKGEECHCWHDFDHALHFLDGRTPAETKQVLYSHPVTSRFYEEEFREKFRRRQPEWLAQMHLAIWQYYDKRLFELFDLRQASLWEQYRKFLKEFYDIKGRRSSIKPPLDKVC